MTNVKSKQLERPNPNNEFRVLEHFIGNPPNGSTGMVASAANGGAVNLLTGAINAPGITRVATGVQTIGSANLRYPPFCVPPGTTGRHNFHCAFRFRLPIAPVSAVESCLWFLGFSNTGASAIEPTNGVYLYIDSTDGIIYAVSARTGTRSYMPHFATPTNAWLECRISMFRNGTARISVQDVEDGSFFDYNFSAAGGFVPTNSAAVGTQFSVLKSAGTTTRQLDLDYIEISADRLPTP